MFADAPLFIVGGDRCLPPSTTITLTGSALTLQNPFSRIDLIYRLSPTIFHSAPGSWANAPPLKDGRQRYETRWIGFYVNRRLFALRAHHADMPKYEAWATNFLAALQEWFEGPKV
jgi:hypothetical protein